MRVLLDTNILIHREARTIARDDIGVLFNWIDRLKYEKCVHPLAIRELQKHQDRSLVRAMLAKVKTYTELKTQAPDSVPILDIRKRYDLNENDAIDTSLLNEVINDRVEYLISEDRKVHAKARDLGISHRVFTIDDFLEKALAEYPKLADYKVLSVKKEYFGNLDLSDPFFDSLREDYCDFTTWYNRKADEIAYVCRSELGKLLAFLYVKLEDEKENYQRFQPQFEPKRRLKIGTFKVDLNGFKLGERLLKIIFDHALAWRVQEIYVTTFQNRLGQQRLIDLLSRWGFVLFGAKTSGSGKEQVYVRDFAPRSGSEPPTLSYPYIDGKKRSFIVPIYPEYHTELFPDSILRTESPMNFIENKPNRNAILKAYISRSLRRDLKSGEIIVFYRTASGGAAYYTSVATTIGIVENVVTGIRNLEDFKAVCRKRTVFDDAGLKAFWDYRPNNRPFVVNFLYVYSLPKRPNFAKLKDSGVLDEAPRGFEPLTRQAFEKLLEISNADRHFVVN